MELRSTPGKSGIAGWGSRRLGRALSDVARRVASFAKQHQEQADRDAEDDAQWLRMEGHEVELERLGLQRPGAPPSTTSKGKITERQLKKAFRTRSRALHPDVNPDRDGKRVRELNAAYEKVRGLL